MRETRVRKLRAAIDWAKSSDNFNGLNNTTRDCARSADMINTSAVVSQTRISCVAALHQVTYCIVPECFILDDEIYVPLNG